jgi:hypothetical protein
VRQNRSPKWALTILFFLVWLGASVPPLNAQSSSQEVVWNQLQDEFMTAFKDSLKQHTYMIQWLNKGTTPIVNFPVDLTAGRPYLIVGVCDNNCTDVDLALQDENRVVVASDTAADDHPMIRFTPSTTATYWIEPTMHQCSADPCGYGIGVFAK